MLPAVETVRARGWACGTPLRSAKWKADRTLEEINAIDICLRVYRPNGSSYPMYVSRLPPDVEVIEEERESA